LISNLEARKARGVREARRMRKKRVLKEWTICQMLSIGKEGLSLIPNIFGTLSK